MSDVISENIDRTRKGFKKRLDELNKKRVASAKELNAVFKEMAKISREQAAYQVAVAVINAYGNLLRRMPVKTGRARAGWMVTTESTERKPTDNVSNSNSVVVAMVGEVRRQIPSLIKADVIYIINNVEYILALEAGWSDLGSGFIALMLEDLKTELGRMVKA